jgi:hypothetical protein
MVKVARVKKQLARSKKILDEGKKEIEVITITIEDKKKIANGYKRKGRLPAYKSELLVIADLTIQRNVKIDTVRKHTKRYWD